MRLGQILVIILLLIFSLVCNMVNDIHAALNLVIFAMILFVIDKDA